MGKLFSASLLASPAHASSEGIDAPAILEQQIQSIPIFPSSKDDAQVLIKSRMLLSNLVVSSSLF